MAHDGKRTGHSPIRRVAATTFNAAEEIQRLYIGYPGGEPIGYGQGDEKSASLVVERTDPLDEPVWYVSEPADEAEPRD